MAARFEPQVSLSHDTNVYVQANMGAQTPELQPMHASYGRRNKLSNTSHMLQKALLTFPTLAPTFATAVVYRGTRKKSTNEGTGVCEIKDA